MEEREDAHLWKRVPTSGLSGGAGTFWFCSRVELQTAVRVRDTIMKDGAGKGDLSSPNFKKNQEEMGRKGRTHIDMACVPRLSPAPPPAQANDDPAGTPYAFTAAACARRALKNRALALLSTLEDPTITAMLLRRFK